MMRRFTTLITALLLLGALAACGDDDTSSPPPDTADDTPSAPVDAPDDGADDGADDPGTDGDDAPPASTGDAGTATVDGVTYQLDEALLCDPDSLDVEGIERELELQAFGAADGGRVQIDVYISDMMGIPNHQVSWSGPEGVYGVGVSQIGDSWIGDNDDAYQDAPISTDGTRATGSAVLYDALTMEDSIEIDFDIQIPSETFACR